MIGIALCTALGMVVAATGLFSFWPLVLISLLFLLFAVIFHRTKASVALLFICVSLIAASRFMAGATPISAEAISKTIRQLPLKNVQLVGRISQPAEYYAYRSGTGGVWLFPLACEGVKEQKDWIRRRGTIAVRFSGSKDIADFRMGERIWLSGELRERNYPSGDPIELVVSGSDHWKILKPLLGLSPLVEGQRLREAASETLSLGIEDHQTQLAVFKALLLGYRKAIPSEIDKQFRQTGTFHIFAISGLHVGIIALLLVSVLKAVGIPRDWWGVWLLPILLFYVCSTGMKSSALRAWTMAGVYFLAPRCRRKPDVPNAVAFTAILLLWLQPLEILSAGFIFSFTVVSFLVMVFSVVPRQIITGGRGVLRPFRAYGASLGITSIAAFIASAPLAALFFGSFSPVSLLGNLVVVPLTFCIVLCGWLSIAFPFSAVFFNYASLVFINGLLRTVHILSEWPGAYWNVPPPPILAVLFWYVGWIAIFTHARAWRERLQLIVLVGVAVVLAIV